ncbi:MAG: glycosyltransferase [Clostridia bacterium]|nr:glycosyltransferase [Clostridia bacterium]
METMQTEGKRNLPHVIYAGHFVPEDQVNAFKGPAVSGTRMQLGIFKAIEDKCELTLISTTPIASYPREKTLRVRGETAELYTGASYTRIPFINVFGIKQLTQIRSLRRALKRVPTDRENTVILNYNPYVEIAIPTLRYAKRHKIKTVCIVADIPVTIPKSYNFIKKFFRKLEIKNYYRFIGKYDALVVLNKHVVSQFADGKRFYLMDGGVTEKEIADAVILPPEQHHNEQILYAGALEPYNGIREMIEGFLKVQKDIRLVICGDGTLASYVKEMAEQHERILYKGKVSHEEAVALQRESGMLISARPTDGFALKLTFPSKIIEYMLSGTPILTTRLNGLGEAYEDKLFFCGQTVDEIAKGIEDFFELPTEERYARAVRAREFVETSKTYTYHSKGIIELIDEVLAE